jgi:phosphoribosylanthranilate isomerase
MDIKICGLTHPEDARAARDAGADFYGVVFAAGSPRRVTEAEAAAVVSALGPGARVLGVFVNEAPDRVLAAARACGLWGVQLHGDERPEAFAGFPLPVWRAVRAGGGVCAPDPALWPAAQRLVVDAYEAGRYGGTGRLADWSLARRLARARPVMLAGGLTPEHVATAVAAVGPAGVDVSSGVEREPGRKDPAKMRAFVAQARAAAAGASGCP